MPSHTMLMRALLLTIGLSIIPSLHAARSGLIGLQQHRSLQQQQAGTAGSKNITFQNTTCPSNLPRVTCGTDPCMRYPCPHGQIGTKNECGKCYCSCSPDNSCSQASITFPHNGTTTTTAAADKPDTDEAASEDAQYQAVFSSGLPVAPTNQCAAKYVACTCSMSCCEGLVCGFPIIRGSAFEQQTGTAYEQVPNAQIVNETAAPGSNSSSVVNSSAPGNSTGSKRSALGNSSTISSSSRSLKSDNKQQQQAPALKPDAVHESGSSSLAALGPSCRPLPEVDLVHGVVNYGC